MASRPLCSLLCSLLYTMQKSHLLVLSVRVFWTPLYLFPFSTFPSLQNPVLVFSPLQLFSFLLKSLSLWLLVCSWCLTVLFLPFFSAFCLSCCLYATPLCCPEHLTPLWFSVKWANGSARSLNPHTILLLHSCNRNKFLLFFLPIDGHIMVYHHIAYRLCLLDWLGINHLSG